MIEHFLFDNVNEDYSNYFKIIELNKNQILFNEGERSNSIYLVLDGIINISTLTLDSKEYVFNTLKKDDLFGDSLSFAKDNRYLGDGIAFTKTKIASISKDDFIHLLSNKTILVNYLEYVSKRNMDTRFQIKLLSQQSIRDKILFYIKSKAINNVLYINSKEELSKELNILRPSLSRELIKLKEDKIISYDKHKIKLL